jgi:hypothetical protein
MIGLSSVRQILRQNEPKRKFPRISLLTRNPLDAPSLFSSRGRPGQHPSSKQRFLFTMWVSTVELSKVRVPMTEKYKLTRPEMNALLRDLRNILKYGDEREFMQVLRKRGIKDEDPRFGEILKLFRELRSGKT